MTTNMDMNETMSHTGDGKVVQTTLDERDYEQFRRVAEAEGIPLNAALRIAVRKYVEKKNRIDDDDPLFETLDSLDETAGEPTDARKMDADLYDR